MPMQLDHAALVDACGGDQKKAARIWHRWWEQRNLQLYRVSQPWPGEEPSDLARLEKKLDALPPLLRQIGKPREIIIYRDKPDTEPVPAKGFTP